MPSPSIDEPTPAPSGQPTRIRRFGVLVLDADPERAQQVLKALDALDGQLVGPLNARLGLYGVAVPTEDDAVDVMASVAGAHRPGAIAFVHADFSPQLRTLWALCPDLPLVMYGEGVRFLDLVAEAGESADRLGYICWPLETLRIQQAARVLLRACFLGRETRRQLVALEGMVEERTIELEEKAVEALQAKAKLEAEVAERRRSEDALRESESRYHALAATSPVGIFRADSQGLTTYVNARFAEITRASAQTVLGFRWTALVHPDDRLKVADAWLRLVHSGWTFSQEFRCGEEEEATWVLGQAAPEQDATGRILGFVGTLTDVTARKDIEDRLRHSAFHDALTGLPNRALLMTRLAQCIERRKRLPGYRYAVLFMDLDRFKLINDSLGHQAGDELLIEVSQRMGQCLRSLDTVARANQQQMARLGGDEFVVLLDGIRDDTSTVRVAERIQYAIAEPFRVGGHTVYSSASIGIAVGHDAYQTPEEILRDADTAMYRAKAQGRGQHQVFDEEMHARAMRSLRLEGDLRCALDTGGLALHYQPVVDAKTLKVIGFEALLRWPHETLGLLTPPAFFSVADEAGLTHELGRFTAMTACRQLAEWHGNGLTDLSVSLNLSVRQITPELEADLEAAVANARLKPEKVHLEITESAMLSQRSETLAVLKRLDKRGFELHLDDFGTGYSSLGHLRLLPLKVLKLDRSFVLGLEEPASMTQTAVIVRSLVDMGHNLGMTITAEGVETQAMLQALTECGVDQMQGYFLARPMSPEQATAWLK